MKKIIVLFCLLAPMLSFASDAELYACGGKTQSNSISGVTSNAWCLGQITPTRFGTWNFGYVNEGQQYDMSVTPAIPDKRDGIYALPQFSYQLTENVETSIALGPYFTSTTITQPDGVHYQDKYRWAGLGFAKVKYNISDSWAIFGQWGHVMYRRDGKDSDLFLFGISRNFKKL